MSRKTRKLMWSVPLIAAVAVIGALAAFMMLAPGALFADGTLGQPGLMAPEAEGPRSIKLTWSAPSGATPTGYRIDVSKDAHVWSELVANHSGTEYVHTLAESDVLTTGNQPVITARYYRVFALNSHGVGDESDIKRGGHQGRECPGPCGNGVRIGHRRQFHQGYLGSAGRRRRNVHHGVPCRPVNFQQWRHHYP